MSLTTSFVVQLKKRAEPIPEDASRPYLTGAGNRTLTNCTIFLGYTSNLISCGVRETLRFLVEHNMASGWMGRKGGGREGRWMGKE